MRPLAWLALWGALAALVSAGPGAAQTGPVLARGNDFGTHVILTLRADPAYHCLVLGSLLPGSTSIGLPERLGGRIQLELGAPFLLAATLDGSLRFDGKGVWAKRLLLPPVLRRLVPRLYFQAVSFPPRRGGGVTARLSPLLVLDLRAPRNPRSQWQAAVAAFRRFLPAPSPQADRPLQTHQGWYRRDPFGNRILGPRGW